MATRAFVTDPGRARGVVVAIALVLAVVGSLAAIHPPPPLAASAPAGAFSAERAMVHVRAIASRPHPMGTDAHAAARDYLVTTLRALGLEVDVQRTTGVTAKYRDAGAVENVVARVYGSRPAHGSVLLAAHYDSVAAGPGAGDDASGVAAILEAVRALRDGLPPANDVVVLFSDGEELGLLGASAFMDEHPWARDVRVAVNLEARGNKGVPSLFETSAGNGGLVDLAARALPGLAGSSLAYEVYKRMPNDTDATIFKAHRLAALNFAFVGGWPAYHTRDDDADHLDRGSLQQQGVYALGLARELGDADLDSLAAPDAVFFSLPGGTFVHHGARWNFVLATACALGLVLAWSVGRAAKATTVAAVVAGAAVFAAGTVLPGLAGVATAQLAVGLHGGLLPDGDVTSSAPYALAAVALALATWGGIFRVARRRIHTDALARGAAFALLAVGVALAATVPGAAYLCLWPAIGASLALIARGALPAAGVGALAASIAALVGSIGLLAPLAYGVFEGLGVGVPGGVVLGVLTAVTAWANVVAFEALRKWSGRLLTAAPTLLALVAFGVGAATTRYSGEHPKPSQLFYKLDLDTGQATWASTAARGDAWVDAYVGANPVRAPLFPGWPRAWAQADAPVVDTARPAQVTATELDRDAISRTLRIDLRLSHPEAIGFDTFSPILDATVNGRPVPPPADGDSWTLSYQSGSLAGATLTLRVKGTAPLRLALTEHTPGVPAVAGMPARPPWAVPRHGGDQTVVHRTLTL